MKKKLTAVLLVVALALSLGLVPAAPAAASQVTDTYTSDVGDSVRMLEIQDPGTGPTDFSELEATSGWTDWHAAVATSNVWPNISGAGWIQSTATTSYPGGDWWYEFKKEVTIPPLAGNISGSIQVNADNANEVHLNGVTYCVTNPPNDTQDGEVYGTWADDYEWGYINTWDVSTSLHTGTNNLLIVIRNYPVGSFNPHGVTYKLTVNYEIPDIEKSFVDSATYTIDVEEADLGDIVGVKLEVENPYAYDLTVMDIIPDGLKYIPGTFEVDGSPVTPTITDNTISTTVGQGDFTITFDVQVVEVQCIVQEDVENRAFLYNGNVQLEASDEIDLNPYEGFDKVIDSGVKEHNGGFIELPDPTVVPIGTDVNWWVLIEVENIDDDAIETMEDVVVQDRLGGDLELLITNVWDDLYGAYSGWTPPGGKKDERTDNTGNVTVQWTGETKKVHLTWDVGDMDDTDSETLALKISTDINPGTGHGKKASGQQEYTSPGWKELNSGAVVKFTDIDGTGFQLSAHTCPLSVYVPDGKLTLDNKDPSTWQIIEDEIGGKLYYSTEGDEFSFVFQGYDLEEEEDYSLIYYADTEDRYVDWGGDNPGALIGTGMTDGAGNLVLSGSIDLGMDLPHPDDANGYHYDYTQAPDYYDNGTGAKIWLVPSDCLTGSTDLPVVVWAPTRFLFETDLITYDDTDD